MSTEIKTQDPCPLCLIKNATVNPLQDRPGEFNTYCRAGHKFQDTEELNTLRAEARVRFPQFYKSPQTPTPRDPQELASMNIVIDPETKKAIEELVSQNHGLHAPMALTGASDIKGLLFGYIKDNEDKDNEIKRMRATMATMRNRPAVAGRPGQPQAAQLAPNQVVVTLPEWAIEGGIVEQAEHAGMSVEDWISQELTAYFENYFSQAPRR